MRALLHIVALLLLTRIAQAQLLGGYAGSPQRRVVLAQEIAMGGAYAGMAQPDASALFANSAALAGLHGTGVCAAAAGPLLGQQDALLGVGIRIGEGAGIGIGIASYGVADIARRTTDGRKIGTMASQDIAAIFGGGLAIGPGSVGATVRVMHRGLSGIDGGSTGYGVDLSGTMTFIDRLYFSVCINNVAGAMTSTYDNGPRETVPPEVRMGAAYVYPLENVAPRSLRSDPTGIPDTRAQRPDAYILGALEIRAVQIGDTAPVLCAALESVPVANIGVGFRLGLNTLGDIGAGFFYRFKVPFADELRIDYAVRREYGIGDITHHLTLMAGF